MKNRFSLYLPLLLAVVMIAGIFLGYKLSPVTLHPKVFKLSYERYNKIQDVINYIEQEYVDSVDRSRLMEDGISGILRKLDPHSQYIPAQDYHEANDPLIGNFEGIGIQFRIEEDTIVVILPVPGGPSEKVGLMAGDRIVFVDDSLVAGNGITDQEAMGMLKGRRGTEVEVTVFRRGIAELIDFVITRDVIPTYSIDISYMPYPEIGYVRLSRFSATTTEEFRKATSQLLEQQMTTLILDLRGNSGGYLQAAIDLADEFLEKGKLIVFTEGYHQERRSSYATQKGSLTHTRLIVLIDEGSASASEILAGAIQDNDRGTLIGRRTYGKGLVQQQLDFPDGSALRLTVARYYTPTGRCIQRPYDKREEGFDNYYSESYHRLLNGELEVADSIHFNDSLQYVTPGGKIVYGGGGIMPDVFVPVEKDSNLVLYTLLNRKSLIYKYSFEYTDRNRKKLNEYPDFAAFDKQFSVTDVIFEELMAYARQHGLAYDQEIKEQDRDRIRMLVKAYIARNLYDNEGFFPIYLKSDPVFRQAIALAQESN